MRKKKSAGTRLTWNPAYRELKEEELFLGGGEWYGDEYVSKGWLRNFEGKKAAWGDGLGFGIDNYDNADQVKNPYYIEGAKTWEPLMWVTGATGLNNKMGATTDGFYG